MERKRLFLAFIQSAVMVLVMVLLVRGVRGLSALISSEDEYPDVSEYGRTRVYVEYTVHSGDTIWDIASEFCTEEYESLKAYVYDIESYNGNSSKIVKGTTITVPVYMDDEQLAVYNNYLDKLEESETVQYAAAEVIPLVETSEISTEGYEVNYYRITITVEDGDTLWSIAEKYRTGGMSTAECVESIMELNGLTDYTIYHNQRLIILVYDEDASY